MNLIDLLDNDEKIVYSAKRSFISYLLLSFCLFMLIYGFSFTMHVFYFILLFSYLVMTLYSFVSSFNNKYILTNKNLIEIKFKKVTKYPLDNFKELILWPGNLIFIDPSGSRDKLAIKLKDSDKEVTVSPFFRVDKLKKEIALLTGLPTNP